jgi:vancomycin resistance protein YoaR
MDEGISQPAAETAQAPVSRGRLWGLGSWYRRHVWSATAVLILAVLVVGFAAVQLTVYGKVGDGVRVAGIELQGLTRREARITLARSLAWRVAPVRLSVTGKPPLDLTLAQLGIRLDTSATAAAAQARGRHRLPVGFSVWLPGEGGEVTALFRVNSAAYQKGLQAVRAVVDVPARDARLDLTGGQIKVAPAADGTTVDAIALERAIIASVGAGRAYASAVPMTAISPRVGTADAQERAGAAASYLSQPITLRYRSSAITLSRKLMAAMLSVNTGTDASQYPLTFRNNRARTTLHRLFAFAESPPVDARVIVHPKGGITVTESRDGEVLDMEVLLEDLDDAATSNGLRSVFVALRAAPPKLSTEDVKTMGLASLGSQYVTYFDPRNTTRADNIALAAKLVDGTVVRPGQTFSLNAAIGPRTTNRGFDYAPVIAADNVLRQGVGGGICQYATTLFNAVFFAGLPVVERNAHSLYISHYPIGRDATVSWGSADFCFRNDTARPLMIRSWVESDHLTVALVGNTGRKVTCTTSPFYDIRKPTHGRTNPRVISDSDLGPGIVRWEQGVNGRSVKVVRTVRNADGALLFRDTFVSRYDPLDWVKRIGT